MSTLLELQQVTKTFGGLIANSQIDATVGKGEILGLIGPNGAGKTTLFNCIAGYLKPDKGAILFDGHHIENLSANRICKLGIARTFQIERIFKDQTGMYNVMVGAFCRTNSRKAAERKAVEVMEFCGFADMADSLAKSLNVCDRKRLEFARALATEPSLLLIDELVAGLNPTEVQEIVDLVRKVRDKGVTVLWVEHVMEAIMQVSDRVIVLDHGEKIAEGAPGEIARDQTVIEAYLGETHHA